MRFDVKSFCNDITFYDLNFPRISRRFQISEVLGLATGLIMTILCSLSGDCVEASIQWHQYIRKLSHLSRWAFRSFHKGWKPERVFPLDFDSSPTSSDIQGDLHGWPKVDESTVVHVCASVGDNCSGGRKSGLPVESSRYGSHTSLGSCLEPPRESVISIAEPMPEIPLVMSDDDIIAIDVEHGSIRVSRVEV